MLGLTATKACLRQQESKPAQQQKLQHFQVESPSAYLDLISRRGTCPMFECAHRCVAIVTRWQLAGLEFES